MAAPLFPSRSHIISVYTRMYLLTPKKIDLLIFATQEILRWEWEVDLFLIGTQNNISIQLLDLFDKCVYVSICKAGDRLQHLYFLSTFNWWRFIVTWLRNKITKNNTYG